MADLLTENQIDNYFIEIGGEIRAQGRAAHLGNWRWAIEDPFSENPRPYKSFYIPQEGISIATSGEYRNPGHIWGGGPRDILSVSVAADDAARADAWATAMYVLGLDEGIIIAETYDLAVFFILSDGNSIQSLIGVVYSHDQHHTGFYHIVALSIAGMGIGLILRKKTFEPKLWQVYLSKGEACQVCGKV